MSKFNTFIKNPGLLFKALGHRGLFNWMNDSTYLKILYFVSLGKKLHLDNPQTFNEKLQWLKLHDRNPLYTTLVDKYAVKNWVAAKIGKQYVIPTLGVWSHFDDIDFDKLPNQFVLKCTHNSGGIVVCKDKKNFDKKRARDVLNNCLRYNFFWGMREWPYKDVPPRIIAEKWMSDLQHNDLIDYKFFCFNGKPRYCQVISDRSTNECIDFFDMDWNFQQFTGLHLPHYPHYPHQPEKPVCFEQMKRNCGVLAQHISFVRIDFYEINGQMFFGEMTFFPASGFGCFTPKEWDRIVGSWLKLPHVVN